MDTRNPKTPWWKESMTFFARISGWVVAPVLISLFLGKYLDRAFNTDPWIFVSMTALAFSISIFGLVKESSKFMKSIVNEKKNSDGNTPRDTTQ